jgi:hypothetical protein
MPGTGSVVPKGALVTFGTLPSCPRGTLLGADQGTVTAPEVLRDMVFVFAIVASQHAGAAASIVSALLVGSAMEAHSRNNRTGCFGVWESATMQWCFLTI